MQKNTQPSLTKNTLPFLLQFLTPQLFTQIFHQNFSTNPFTTQHFLRKLFTTTFFTTSFTTTIFARSFNYNFQSSVFNRRASSFTTTVCKKHVKNIHLWKHTTFTTNIYLFKNTQSLPRIKFCIKNFQSTKNLYRHSSVNFSNRSYSTSFACQSLHPSLRNPYKKSNLDALDRTMGAPCNTVQIYHHWPTLIKIDHVWIGTLI